MPVTIIMIKARESAVEIPWGPVSASDIRQYKTRRPIDVRRPADVIAHKQIEFAVVVIINPGCTRAPAVGAPNTCFAAHFTKLALAFVMEKAIPTDGRDEDVAKPIIIIITNGQPHAV